VNEGNMGMSNVSSDEESRLIEKLRKIETLFARTTNPGERQAAESALERIRRRLDELEQTEQPVEFRFSLPDGWSKSLLVALLRRYGLKPYRYAGQRRTTVRAKVAASFVDEVLWPEFQELNTTLCSHLDSVTRRIIQQAVHSVDTDIEERPGREPMASQGEKQDFSVEHQNASCLLAFAEGSRMKLMRSRDSRTEGPFWAEAAYADSIFRSALGDQAASRAALL